MKLKPSEYTKHELLEETIRTALQNYKEEVVNREAGVIFIIEAINASLRAARVEGMKEALKSIEHLGVGKRTETQEQAKGFTNASILAAMRIDKLIEVSDADR